MALILVLVTHPDDVTAKQLAEGALDAGLAACILRAPVTSLYDWEGERKQDGEVLTLFKTSVEMADALEAWLIENHPYDVPAIIRLGARPNQAYEDWVKALLTSTH